MQYNVLQNPLQLLSFFDDTLHAITATPDATGHSKSLFSSMNLIQVRMLLACCARMYGTDSLNKLPVSALWNSSHFLSRAIEFRGPNGTIRSRLPDWAPTNS